MIKELTKKQEELIPIYRQKWLDAGYRTETIDREKAKEYVNILYTDILGLEKPKYYLFLDSPLMCQMALHDCQVVHPEHKPTLLQEGVSYRVAKTMEYDQWKEESREVID